MMPRSAGSRDGYLDVVIRRRLLMQTQPLGTTRLNPEQGPAEVVSSGTDKQQGAGPAAPAVPSGSPLNVVSPSAEPLTWEQIEDLRQRIIAALCTCFDPEIP